MLQIIESPKLDPDKFCFWLQGFCELHGNPPTGEQWKMIKEHLEMVFLKVRPAHQTVTTTTPNAIENVDWNKLRPRTDATYIC